MTTNHNSENQITAKDLETLVQAQFDAIELLKQEIAIRYKKIDFLNNLIATGEIFVLEPLSDLSELNLNQPYNRVYDPEWAWYDKALHFIRTQNRFLTVKQIAAEAKKIESNIDLAKAPSAINNQLTPRIDKAIRRFKILDSGEYFYGPISWFDQHGKPKEEYYPVNHFAKS